MGVCSSRPRIQDGPTPIMLSAKKGILAITYEVTTVEASSTNEVKIKLSGSIEETKKEEEEPRSVDVIEPKMEEPKSEEAAAFETKVEEEEVNPQETEGKPKEEATCTVSTTAEVDKEIEKEVVVENKKAEEMPIQKKEIVEVEPTQA